MFVYKKDDFNVPIKSWVPEEQYRLDAPMVAQCEHLVKLPFAFHHFALSPDGHVGYGMPIGGIFAAEGVIIPNCVGVDISCGANAVKTSLNELDIDTLKTIMGKVRAAIPVGFNHHKTPQKWEGFDRAPNIPIVQQELNSARKQLGTLGGNNHFIEFQIDGDSNIWVMLHSGSRNFGLKTANIYHKLAQSLCEKWHVQLPDKDLAFLPMDSAEGREYFDAMTFCMEFAMESRAHMMRATLEIMNDVADAEKIDEVNIHHNYAAMENHFGKNVMVHRKGATRARLGEKGIIPGSMGSSSYIVEGLGNPESFNSCSHGAGRRMGRKEACRTLNLEEEQKKMVGIVHGLRNASDLDEAPGSYKSIDDVMNNQTDLVKILVKLRPLGSIKG